MSPGQFPGEFVKVVKTLALSNYIYTGNGMSDLYFMHQGLHLLYTCYNRDRYMYMHVVGHTLLHLFYRFLSLPPNNLSI